MSRKAKRKVAAKTIVRLSRKMKSGAAVAKRIGYTRQSVNRVLRAARS
jgi:predicted transcriptional regulator